MYNNLKESDLELMIYNNHRTIHEKGFVNFYSNTKRQMIIESGRVDLITYEDDFERKITKFRLIELKRGILTESALLQAAGYLSGIIDILKKRKIYKENNFESVKYEIILCGTGIENNLSVILSLGCKIRAFTYQLDINGLCFEEYVFDDPNLILTHGQVNMIISKL